MALFADWETLAELPRSQEEQRDFWETYFNTETEIYKKILVRLDNPYKGKLSDVAEELEIEPVILAGFIDGGNTSLLAGEMDLDSLTDDSEISLEMDTEKLYYNMLDAKADWLYGLPEWEEILTPEKRAEIAHQYRKDCTYVAPPKIGRNDPCPCGSNKKYKNCHGKPGADPLPEAVK